MPRLEFSRNFTKNRIPRHFIPRHSPTKKPARQARQIDDTTHNPPFNLCSAVTVVDDDVCLELAGNKPATNAACNEGKVCPIWYTSKWKPCTKLCGEGKQTRQVVCYRKEEDGKITVLDDADCQDEKPEEEKDCLVQPCEGVEYITSSWGGVSVYMAESWLT